MKITEKGCWRMDAEFDVGSCLVSWFSRCCGVGGGRWAVTGYDPVGDHESPNLANELLLHGSFSNEMKTTFGMLLLRNKGEVVSAHDKHDAKSLYRI